MSNDTIIVRVEVSRQTLQDLLCTAVEGGSNYWAEFSNRKRTPNLDYLEVTVIEKEGSIRKVVKAEDLALGLEQLAQCSVTGQFKNGTPFPAAGKHFNDALGDHDAETADVVLQMTVFGELVYG